jgi:hypothetical protein
MHLETSWCGRCVWARPEQASDRHRAYRQSAGSVRARGRKALMEALDLSTGALCGDRIADKVVLQFRLVEVQNIQDDVTAHQEESAQRHSPHADRSAPPTTEEVHGSPGRQEW